MGKNQAGSGQKLRPSLIFFYRAQKSLASAQAFFFDSGSTRCHIYNYLKENVIYTLFFYMIVDIVNVNNC